VSICLDNVCLRKVGVSQQEWSSSRKPNVLLQQGKRACTAFFTYIGNTVVGQVDAVWRREGREGGAVFAIKNTRLEVVVHAYTRKTVADSCSEN